MRITNVFGAIIALIMAIALDYALLTPLFDWVVAANLDATTEAIMMLGVFGVFAFITIIVPVLIAVADEKGVSGE